MLASMILPLLAIQVTVGELDLEYMVGLQFEMTPGDPWIGNFYLKKTLNIFYLSVLKYTLQYIGDIFSHYGFQ